MTTLRQLTWRMATDKEAKSGEVETPRKSNHTKESLQLLFENTDKIEFDSEEMALSRQKHD